MYPLNMSNLAVGGYAVANTEDEHKALSGIGYEPRFFDADKVADVLASVAPPLYVEKLKELMPTIDALRAELDAKGISYDKRWGEKKLREALEG